MNNPTAEQIKQQLSDSSRKLADLTASMVYEKPALLKNLLEVAWLDEEPWSNRASRVISICCCSFPELIRPYVSQIIKKLNKQRSEGVLRNFLKIFCDIPIKLSERDTSLLLNHCFDYLTGPYPVSIQVYSMDIVYKLSITMPEIQRELYEIIDNRIAEASAGFKSRGSKILKKISKNYSGGFSSH